VTQRNASAAEELASTAEEMESQAESLQQLTSFFQVVNGQVAGPGQRAPAQLAAHAAPQHARAPLHHPGATSRRLPQTTAHDPAADREYKRFNRSGS